MRTVSDKTGWGWWRLFSQGRTWLSRSEQASRGRWALYFLRIWFHKSQFLRIWLHLNLLTGEFCFSLKLLHLQVEEIKNNDPNFNPGLVIVQVRRRKKVLNWSVFFIFLKYLIIFVSSIFWHGIHNVGWYSFSTYWVTFLTIIRSPDFLLGQDNNSGMEILVSGGIMVEL